MHLKSLGNNIETESRNANINIGRVAHLHLRAGYSFTSEQVTADVFVASLSLMEKHTDEKK